MVYVRAVSVVPACMATWLLPEGKKELIMCVLQSHPVYRASLNVYLPACRPGEIEPLIWEKVVQWFADPSSFQEEIKRQYQPGGGEGLRQQIKFIEQNIDNIKKQREKILALFQKDLLMQEEVEERLKEFNVNLEKLNQQNTS